MKPEEYIESRVDNQMAWFEKKSAWNKKKYISIKTFELLIAVSIPFLAGIAKSNEYILIAVGMMGVSIAGLEGIQSLYKFQDLWVQYRMTAEILLQEKMLFITKTEEYEGDNEEAFKLFVQKIESTLASETSKWRNQVGKTESKKKKANNIE